MTKYQIQVHDQSSWNTDGTPIVLRDCGHAHRTISGAVRCFEHLTRLLPDRSYLAAWYHAAIYNADGTHVSDTDRAAFDDAMAR